MAQIRGHEIANQQFRYSNPEHFLSFIFLTNFLLHNIGNLIENRAALLAASVNKIASGRGADVRT